MPRLQPNKQRQSDNQHYAPSVLLAVAQALTQKVLRAGCACAGRKAYEEANSYIHNFAFHCWARANGWLFLEKSDFFVRLDKDQNGQLSFPEWHAYYGSHKHDLYSCSRSDFFVADCNNDEQITWKEYYDFRFDRKGICGELSTLSGYENRQALYHAMKLKEEALLHKYFGSD